MIIIIPASLPQAKPSDLKTSLMIKQAVRGVKIFSQCCPVWMDNKSCMLTAATALIRHMRVEWCHHWQSALWSSSLLALALSWPSNKPEVSQSVQQHHNTHPRTILIQQLNYFLGLNCSVSNIFFSLSQRQNHQKYFNRNYICTVTSVSDTGQFQMSWATKCCCAHRSTEWSRRAWALVSTPTLHQKFFYERNDLEERASLPSHSPMQPRKQAAVLAQDNWMNNFDDIDLAFINNFPDLDKSKLILW